MTIIHPDSGNIEDGIYSPPAHFENIVISAILLMAIKLHWLFLNAYLVFLTFMYCHVSASLC